MSLHLYTIIEELPKNFEKEKLPVISKKSFVIDILSFLIIFSFLNGIRKIIVDQSLFIVPRLLHPYDLVIPAIVITIILFIIYILTIFKFFYKSSWLPNMLVVGIIGALGFFLTSLTTLKEVNTLFDNNPGIEYQLPIVNKRISNHKFTSYYIKLAGLDEIKTTSKFYHNVAINDMMNITEKPGYLHYPWISKIIKDIP